MHEMHEMRITIRSESIEPLMELGDKIRYNIRKIAADANTEIAVTEFEIGLKVIAE